jgi:hypothetical protein
VLVSLVFIGGSALLNFRMGYTAADNATDGKIYGSLAAAGDGLKAVSPFVAAYGWKHRQWLAVAAAALVFVCFTAYSFTSALGFSSQHRAAKEGTNRADMERHEDARQAIDRARARLDALGPQRASAEVSQEITNRMNAPVGSGRWTVDQVSEGCTKNRPLTRQACQDIANLKAEALRAWEAEKLDTEITALTLNSKTARIVTTADAQTDALRYLGRLLHVLPPEGKDTVEDPGAGEGLALLMAVFIELGSGLGLYIATTPWRVCAPAPSPPTPASFPAIVIGGPPLEAFVAECLQLRQGGRVHAAEMFETYKEWCARRDRPMQGKSRFERGILKLAKELGLAVDSGRAGWLVQDVVIKRKAA